MANQNQQGGQSGQNEKRKDQQYSGNTPVNPDRSRQQPDQQEQKSEQQRQENQERRQQGQNERTEGGNRPDQNQDDE